MEQKDLFGNIITAKTDSLQKSGLTVIQNGELFFKVGK